MTSHLNRPKAALLGQSLIAAAFSLTATHVFAQLAAEGPFTGLAGYWTGGGTITMSNGSNERIRCKGTYAVNDTGKALNQSLRCASDSYRLEISGNIIFSGGSLSGTWGEATRHASGSITGRANGKEILARVDGAGFSAGLEVHFRGDRQSVSIKPTSGTDVSNVAITLRKG